MKYLGLCCLALVLMSALAGCGHPVDAPTPILSFTPTSTNTPPPTITPSPTKTIIGVRAKDQPVNCRVGPGLVFDIVGGLNARQSTRAEGRSVDSTWLFIQDPGNPGGFCWVAATAVEINGDVAALAIVNAPAITVIRLEVRVEPAKITVACGAFPQIFGFTAEITTNGPTKVVMRWEVNTGDMTPDKTLIFERAATQTVQEFYKVNGPNDYRVRLHVLGPNEMTREADFFAICTP